MVAINFMSDEAAFEIIEDELANYTEAVLLIQDRFYNFHEMVEYIKHFKEVADQPETTVEMCDYIEDQFYNDSIYLLQEIPGIMICHPQVHWANLINAIIVIFNEYIGYQDTIIKERPGEDQSTKLEHLKETLQHIVRYIEFGSSVEGLLAVTMQLIERVERLDSNQPISFQLSKAYLDALNFQGKDEQII